MRFDILTIFPNFFNSFLEESLIAKAREAGILDIQIHDIRSFSTDKHATVDDRPFGGGPGMVLKVEPLYAALKSIDALPEQRNKKTERVYILSPRGTQYDQQMTREFAGLERVILIAGRYEGIDARIEEFVNGLLSVGPYILSGGELPAMSIVESVARLLPGYMGNIESVTKPGEEAASEVDAEYPVYTRPEIFETDSGETLEVPPVLLSGDHAAIDAWRSEHSN